MLSRYLVSMDLKESQSEATPFDGVVLLMSCDETAPTLPMASPPSAYPAALCFPANSTVVIRGPRRASGKCRRRSAPAKCGPRNSSNGKLMTSIFWWGKATLQSVETRTEDRRRCCRLFDRRIENYFDRGPVLGGMKGLFESGQWEFV